MNPQRPFLALSIESLESIVDNSDDVVTLLQVKAELGCRTTRAAKHLAAYVDQKLAHIAKHPKMPSAPQQGAPELGDGGLPSPTPHEASPGSRGQETTREKSSNPKGRPLRRQSGAKPNFKPTGEQVAAVDAFMTGGTLKISAFAGSGKTSTLKLMAHERAGQGLYLAFNKKIADEAGREFPSEVDCRTTHSLAARAVRAQYSFDRDKMFNSMRPKQLAEVLELKKRTVEGVVSLTAVQQAFLILATVRRFSQSGDQELSHSHVPVTGRLKFVDEDALRVILEWAVREARGLWVRMLDAKDPIPLGHDGYLKLWSLGAPRLDQYQYILLDEAQDTSPVVLSVLTAQNAQTVYVGDRHQQIYEWRGAINAMEMMPTEHEEHLTQSFRFGSAIASEASGILRSLREPRQLIGNSNVPSKIVNGAHVEAVLARTNAMVFQMALGYLEEGRIPYFVGGTQELERLVSDVFSLQKGEPGVHPDFIGFTNWAEVVEFAGTEEGEELFTFVALVQKYGPKALWAAIKRSAPSEELGDVTVSTAHKAKGMEWSSVLVANDFAQAGEQMLPRSEADARLFYVAITRAKNTLSVNPDLLAAYSKAAPFPKEGESRAAPDERPRAKRTAPNGKPSAETPSRLRPTLVPDPPEQKKKRRGWFGR